MSSSTSTGAFVDHELNIVTYNIDHPDGIISDVPVYRLNLYFQFHDVYTSRNAHQLGSYIRDPSALVASVELQQLITWFKFLSLKDLRRLADIHSVAYRQQTKQQLLDLLQHHSCRLLCGSCHLVVFKTLPHPRTTTMPVSATTIPVPSPPHRNNHIPRQPTAHIPISDSPIDPDRASTPGTDEHLALLHPDLKLSILQEWQQAMSTTNLTTVVCAACGSRVSQSMTEWVPPGEIDLELLTNSDLPDALLPQEYAVNAYGRAILNFKGLKCLDAIGDMRMCATCISSLRKGRMPRLALANHLYSARAALPSHVQAAFSESSILDRKLICRARCNNICCKFTGGDPSGSALHSTTSTLSRARRGVKGNIMVVPLDVIRMNQVIPPPTSSIRDTFCAVFVGSSMPSRQQILGSKYSPILVRRSRVKTMLQFLLDCNPFYNLRSGDFTVSEENLNALFTDDGDEVVPQCVQIGHIESNDAIDVSTGEYAPRGDAEDEVNQDDQFLMENVGYTDGDTTASNYMAMKALALERCRRGMPFLLAGTKHGLLSDFNNPAILSCLFPHLDPWGIMGFHHVGRRVKISMEEQLSHLLLSDDESFQRDPEFAFVFYNVLRKMRVSESIRFSVSPTIHRQLASSLMNIDPEVLLQLGKKFAINPNYRPLAGAERNAHDVMSSISMVARHIPGSNGYKVLLRSQIRALINHQGTPTLFLTLNPSDVDNPIVRLLAGQDIVLEDLERGEDIRSWDRRLFAAKHPAACAIFFHLIMTKFISIGLGYRKDGSAKLGLFGRCSGYYGTVEAQGKGTLHCHLLIWLRGHLSPARLREEMASSEDYRNKVFSWVESIIKCEFPIHADNAERSVFDIQPQERVKHRDLGDPHPGVIPAPSTVITPNRTREEFWTEYHAYVVQLLHTYNWHVHSSTCWKYLRRGEARNDRSCRLRMNGVRREYTTTDEETGALLLRRHHPKLAAYNDAVTFMLQCNTELKFIGSGKAARDLAFYVTDYVTKPTLPVHAGMAALQYAVQKVTKTMAASTQGLTTGLGVSTVITAVNSMMGRHEISHPQVMSYLVGGGDHYTSHKFAILSWSSMLAYIDKLYRAYRPQTQDHNDVIDSQQSNMDLDIRKESITASNQQLDYIYRNEGPQFDCLNLYDFVAFTAKATIPAKMKSARSVEEISGSFCTWHHPQRSTHYLRRRQEEHVPVLLGPSFPNPARSSEVREKWARNVLILFKPWRNVQDLIGNHETWLEAYEAYQDDLSPRHQAIVLNMNAFSESMDARGEAPVRSARGADDTFEPDVQPEDTSTVLVDSEMSNLPMDEQDFDNEETHIDDVFICTDNNARHDEHLDSIIAQRVGPEIVPSLDQCHASDADSVFTMRPNRESGTLVGLEDLPTIVEHQTYMRTKKQNRVAHQDDDSDNEAEREMLGSNPTFVRRREMVDVITLPRDRVRTPEETLAIQGVIQQVIADMNLASNPEQLRAFELISNHLIGQNPEQLLMYVSGVGGTGKSHVIKAVVALFAGLGCRESLVLGAPTGIAAVLIGGHTLHSLALLGPHRKGRNIERLVKIWKDVKYLIIDEVSMIGAKFLAQFSNRLREAKTGHGITVTAPFGGINVIFMGDFGQLKPPIQHSLYAHVITQQQSFKTATSVDGIDSTNGVLLWRQVKTVVELTRNQRHANDPYFAEFLLRLRRGECTPPRGPSGTGDWEYLKARLLHKLDHETLQSFRDAPIVVGSKVVRDALNAKLINYHAKRLGVDVGLYHSVDTVSRAAVPIGMRNRLWNIPSSLNNEAFGRLPIFVGMKVMITENIAFSNGIVNGSEGTIRAVQYQEDAYGIKTAVVAYVHVENCGISLPDLEDDVVPIFPVSTRIDFPFNISSTSRCTGFTRKQLPLVPAYAYTDFKSQGRTLTRVIIDIVTARGQGVYVMLSRVKSLSGLAILRWFPATKVYSRVPAELREELERLSRLASAHAT